MPTIDDEIKVIDCAICRYLDNIDNSTRAVISQDILAHLKNLVEHVMLKYYFPHADIDDSEEIFFTMILALKSCIIWINSRLIWILLCRSITPKLLTRSTVIQRSLPEKERNIIYRN